MEKYIKSALEVGYTRVDTEKDGSNTMVHYISTPVLNRNGHIINQYGIDNSNYLKNPVILFNHNSGNNPFTETTKVPIIGDSKWQKADEKGYLVKSSFYTGTDLTDDFWTLVNQGYRPAWSFGGNPLDKPEIVILNDMEVPKFNKVDLAEYSWVLIPADPNTVTANFEPKSEIIKNYLVTENEKLIVNNVQNELKELQNKYTNDLENITIKYSELENKFNDLLDKQTKEKSFNQEIINKQQRDSFIKNVIEQEFKKLLGKV